MSRRDEIKDYLRSRWEPVSVDEIAAFVGDTYDHTYDSLRTLKKNKQADQDDAKRWYLCANSVVPEGVAVRREPVVRMPLAALEEKVDIQTLPMPEPTELGKVAMVPTAELEKPAVDWDDRDEMPEIRIELQIPTWVARRVMDVLEQASRESKAAGRLWGTET